MNRITDIVTASQIMTRDVKTISSDSNLREAAQILYLHNIAGAPVTDPDTGKVVGIISESDLINTARKRAALPHIAAFGLFMAPEESLRRIYHEGAMLLISEVMTSRVISVPPEMPVAEIGETMIRHKINRVPVLDAEGRLIGIITRHDVLRNIFHLSD